MTLADSTVLIDWLRGHEPARGLLGGALARGETVVGSVLSRTEVLGGMRSSERVRVAGLLDALDWAPVTVEIADAAGSLARCYRRSHATVTAIDYVIAATATKLGAELWTSNVRHFPMFSGLRPPY